ncbi:hypothetical protein NPIL_237981 [Nephila pilipes]|uniref:Uncharacterized protein n=1 Tax=Nephila pilipes TaxID=299642 RepID=A0A8X6IDS2_NEPPI|nr:hypothetical protein NPIL_237981 [Nephila pilipes]
MGNKKIKIKRKIFPMCTDISKGGRKRNVIRNTSPHPPHLPVSNTPFVGATFFLALAKELHKHKSPLLPLHLPIKGIHGSALFPFYPSFPTD